LKLAWRGWFGEERAVRKAPGGLSWWKEIWPMQWRMAISAGASYFILQLFNPVLFYYQGSVTAGQMGMTLTAANALLAGSLTLMNAKTPEFGKLIAVSDWHNLDHMFFHSVRKTFVLVATGAVTGIFAIWILQRNFAVGQRFLPVEQVAILFGAICIQALYYAIAIYLRAHKQEPLLTMTILASVLQGTITWYCGKHYSSLGVTIGFLFVSAFFIFPYALFVWHRCRKTWHANSLVIERSHSN
jgi:O-antigen/teichoic acid export membrane protein